MNSDALQELLDEWTGTSFTVWVNRSMLVQRITCELCDWEHHPNPLSPHSSILHMAKMHLAWHSRLVVLG